MNILVVDQSGQLGGGELSLLDLLGAWGRQARVVLFAHGPFEDVLRARGVRVEVWDAGAVGGLRRRLGLVAALRALPRLARMVTAARRAAGAVDVVYANSQKAFVIAALAGGAPLAWHLRDMLTSGHFGLLNRAVAVWLANRRAKVVIVNSRATGDAFVAAGGNPAKVRLVYNGIDPAPFDSVPPGHAASVRADLELDASTPLVGLFGRLTPWKGQHVLLDALALLPGVHALIVGDALFGEADYARALRARAALPDLAGRVHFLGFRDDVPALMKAVDIVCHTSTDPEPFGRVVIEGMLAHRPVIAAAEGGPMEILRDGETGMLVPPSDPRRLAEAIALLAGDPEHRMRLANAANTDARLRFSRASMTSGVQQAIAEARGKLSTQPAP